MNNSAPELQKMDDFEDLPSLADILQSGAIAPVSITPAEGEGGGFPVKDSNKNQMLLSVDFRRLTMKQAKLFRNWLSGNFKTIKDAAIDAGYSPATAAQAGSRALRDRAEDFSEIMNGAGVTLEAVAETIGDALEAQVQKWDNKKQAFVEGADHGNRLKAADLAIKGHKVLQDEAKKIPDVLILNLNGTGGDGDTGSPVPGKAVAAEAGSVSQ